MPVYSEDLSATANPAASLNQANLVSQKTTDHWTDNAANMQFEDMFSFQVYVHIWKFWIKKYLIFLNNYLITFLNFKLL